MVQTPRLGYQNDRSGDRSRNPLTGRNSWIDYGSSVFAEPGAQGLKLRFWLGLEAREAAKPGYYAAGQRRAIAVTGQ